MIYQTSRLLLKYVQADDIPELYDSIFSDPSVMKHAFGGSTFSLDETETFIEQYAARESEKLGIGMLFLRESNVLIGFAGLLPYDLLGKASCELGFVLATEHWGKGYATEIGRGQIALADTLGYAEVLALVAPENDASKAVLEKLGMAYLGESSVAPRGKREIYRRETI